MHYIRDQQTDSAPELDALLYYNKVRSFVDDLF